MGRRCANSPPRGPGPKSPRPRERIRAVAVPRTEEGMTMATGIRRRHGRNCRSRSGGSCNCSEGWEASVYSKRDGKKIRKTFAREADAKSWRADALTALGKGTMRAPKPTTVREAWETWHQGIREGTIRNRSGDPFKPSAIRSY